MAAIGHQGLNNLLMAYADKSAEAVCTFAYSSGPGHEPVLFQGRCQVRSAAVPGFTFLICWVLGQDRSAQRAL